MNKTPYEMFWIGKKRRGRKATEEYLKVLEYKQISKQDIAKKYVVSTEVITRNIKLLGEEKLIDVRISNYVSENILCDICHKEPKNHAHHFNYDPEITINICESCHTLIHNHGTGTKKIIKKQNKMLSKNSFLPWVENQRLAKKMYMRIYRSKNKEQAILEVKKELENVQ